ncbi:outer membrane protein assembly factor BamB family protein [Thalassoroseus pseudoceratinae]|uniref:outer membrane protein assembly factor BamB family protein n=1 Tax=Thalassoroseus pseudoceratinae TaxID=2713176 RepID=UPI0014237114|nr:PQQ-binding-like beta-propeller repeat protein [Thalassoroseus pseudoceratinae]
MRLHTLLTLLVLGSATIAQADWRQFRGNDGDGVAEDSKAPASLEESAWEVDLPGRGLSGPIVVGEKVFVTASSGPQQDKLHVLCFDQESGDQLWERKFWATGRTGSHKKMCNATPTPCSDGEHIYAFFSSNDLIALDLEGNLLWYRGLTYDYPNASNSLGMSSSPVVVAGTVVCQVESDAEAFAVGVDATTGEERWKIARPRKANWTSPCVYAADSDKPLVLLQSSEGLTAVEPKTGETVWQYTDGASTIPSSVVSADIIYVPSNGITALRPIAASSAPEITWQEGGLSPSTPSPLVYQGRIYTVNRSGALTCANIETGKREWQLRLRGPFSSTPVAADGKLYFFGERGDAQIVEPGEKRGKVVSEKKFDATFLASPAISQNAVFVRSDEHLWKIK